MKYDSNIHHRKSIRLKNYDYSQAGLYFITICTQHQLHLFGEIVNDEMVLNDAGKMVWDEWHTSEKIHDEIKMHEFIIMPNHIHGIIEITVGAPLVGAQNTANAQNKSGQQQEGKTQTGQPVTGQPQGIAPTVGDIIGAFKSLTTHKYIQMVKQNMLPPFDKKIWQRNYWEHIIRNGNEYQRIAQYIMDNPKKWALDKLNGGTGNSVMEPSEFYNQEAWMI